MSESHVPYRRIKACAGHASDAAPGNQDNQIIRISRQRLYKTLNQGRLMRYESFKNVHEGKFITKCYYRRH